MRVPNYNQESNLKLVIIGASSRQIKYCIAPTVGVDFKLVKLKINDTDLALAIWVSIWNIIVGKS